MQLPSPLGQAPQLPQPTQPQFSVPNVGPYIITSQERNVKRPIYERGDVRRYGGNGDGTGNDTQAIADALFYIYNLLAGGSIYIPYGLWPTDEIVLSADGKEIATDGIGTKLLARANGQRLLKVAASNCRVSGLTLDNNGFANVEGFALAPANENDHVTQVNQNYNRIYDLVISGCLEAFRMRCGPGTLTGDSGCWYNSVFGIQAVNCIRGIWMQSCVANAGGGATTGSQVNRNFVYAARIGQNTNVALQIDAGGTNEFHGFAAEGVQNGAGPQATPTGIVIAASDPVTGGANDSNKIYGYEPEANTRDVFNDNALTEFYGNGSNPAKRFGAFPNGAISTGGSPFFDPQISLTRDIIARAIGRYRVDNGGAVIANGATFDINIPNARQAMLVMISNTANLGLWRIVECAGDGAGNLQFRDLGGGTDRSGGQIVITPHPTKLTITNNTGFACQWEACVTTGLMGL